MSRGVQRGKAGKRSWDLILEALNARLESYYISSGESRKKEMKKGRLNDYDEGK